MMMTIQATFTGRCGSMGYKKGQSYRLIVAPFRGMSVQREDGTGVCPYQSLSAFLRNWSDVKLVPDVQEG